MDASQKTLTRSIAIALVAAFVLLNATAHAAPKRIVSVIPAVTEMLFAMGAGDDVVGVGSYDHFPKEADAKPKVGALLDPNFELILTLHPDLVVVYNSQTEFIAKLTQAKIPMFRYEHAGLIDITATIRKLGDAVGRTKNAEAIASSIERDLDAIRARVAGERRVRTMLVFGREPGSLRNIYASGGVGFLHDLLELAGGADVFGDVKRQSVQTNTEQVLARAPEAIIELHESLTPDTRAREVSEWSILASVPAVRNKQVHLLTGDFLTVPGPRIALAARAMADALHPQK